MTHEKIVAEHVGQRFAVSDREEGLLALDDVNFTVREGEFISIVGESGCGKTTLLRIVAGLIHPTNGELRYEGQPITAPRREFGFVFQRAVLLDWRTVLDNVLLPVEIAGYSRKKYLQRARDLLDMAGVAAFADRYPRQLSGGMQQRVALVRALLLQPSVLLLDEPFGALDAITREQLQMELLWIWSQQRSTAIFITHDIPEAVFLSDRILLMKRRPGTIRRVFDVPLPRPRTLEHRFSEPFIELSREIRLAMLGEIKEGEVKEG